MVIEWLPTSMALGTQEKYPEELMFEFEIEPPNESLTEYVGPENPETAAEKVTVTPAFTDALGEGEESVMVGGSTVIV